MTTSTRLRFAALAIVATCLLAATPALAERRVTDAAGRSLVLPDRIERVYAMGHTIPVVGAVAPGKLINTYKLPEAAHRYLAPALYEGKVVPTSGKTLSDEEVLRAAPQLIVMENVGNASDLAERLQARLHLPVVLIDQDLLRCKASFTLLGELLGETAQAQRMADFVSTHLDPIPALAKTIPENKRVRVYYAEGPDGLSTNPSGSNHTEIIDYVGGINVAKVEAIPGEGMNSVNMEQIYLWQPQLILVWTPNADQLMTWHAITRNPLWQRVDAVRQGHVVQIPWLPFSWFDRPPGSNRMIGVLWLAQRLYPDVYHYDLIALTREYFRIFYHHPLSEAEARSLLALADPATPGGKR
jgi:iron complex transport system substrate-binding protein